MTETTQEDDDFLTPTEGSAAWVAELRRRCPTPEETDALLDRSDRLAAIERDVQELADRLKREAYEAVPPEYADRDLHYKYLRLDTEAAGKDEAADRLLAILDPPDHP